MTPGNDTPGDQGGPSEGATTDAAFRALRHPVRRFVVRYLEDHERTDVDTLATVVTGRRSATSGEVQDRTDRGTVRLQLVHRHLPVLATAGFVEHDRESGRVTLDSPPEPTTRILEEAARREAGTGETDQ